MKKLFKSFGLAVVIAVIALNALLVTGCPDVGIDASTGEGTPKPSGNPPDPKTPTLDGKLKTITLGANRWDGGTAKGENWSSGNQIKLADYAGIKLARGNTYIFRIQGNSDKVLSRVQLQIFSGNNFETWLGSQLDLIELGTTFDEKVPIKIDNAPTPGLPVLIQLNNIMWQKNAQGVQIFAEPNTPIPEEFVDGTTMATITNFSISLYDIGWATPPEQSPVEDRWVSYVDGGSTATLTSEFSDGIMTAVVGGTAMPNVQDNWNAWRAQVGYYYTAEANAQYTFKFEAWTKSGTRNLHLQYYENVSTDTYLAKDTPITSTRTTYTVISDIIPTGGIEQARFILADQLGTVYIRIISIEKFVFTGGTLTVSNIFGGDHGLEIGSMLDGSTDVRNGLSLVFGSAPDKYETDGGDWAWHWYGKEIPITGDPVHIYVWQVNYYTNTYTPFTGNITIPPGELELNQSNFKGANGAWSGDDYYRSIVPITFTNGSANINFGTQMEYDGTWIPGANGEEGHYVTPYQITITGVGGKTGTAYLGVYSDMYIDNGEVLWGAENISGSSTTINLRKNNEAAHPFTGSGSYYLTLDFNDNYGNYERYYYTNGQSFASLNITQESDFYEHYNRLPKYNITTMPFTIDLSKFQKRPEPQEWYAPNRITTITITNTGITDYRGGTFTLAGPYYNYSLNTKFSNGNITSYFLDVESNSYFLRFDLYENNGWDNYVYTGGQTFAQLGIASESDLDSKLPRYNISSGTTISINFNQFKKEPKPYEWYSSYKTITFTGLGDGWMSNCYLVGSNHYYPVYTTYSWNGDSQDMTTYWVNFENYPGSYYLQFDYYNYNGSYYVQELYVYTNGQTLASLGISSIADFDKLPKFTVTTMPNTTIIDFSKFKKVPDSWR